MKVSAMLNRFVKVMLLTSLSTTLPLLAGCRASARVGEPGMTSEGGAMVRPGEDNELKRLALRIITAGSGPQEADAINALREYETDHKLTYQTQVVRLDTNTVLSAGSIQPYPLRVDVSIFEGQVPVYSFSFVPRDNRNLALLGL